MYKRQANKIVPDVASQWQIALVEEPLGSHSETVGALSRFGVNHVAGMQERLRERTEHVVNAAKPSFSAARRSPRTCSRAYYRYRNVSPRSADDRPSLIFTTLSVRVPEATNSQAVNASQTRKER